MSCRAACRWLAFRRNRTVSTLPMLRWTLGTLAPAESKSIVITTTAPTAAGVITNSAIASAWQNVVTQTLLSTQIVNTARFCK